MGYWILDTGYWMLDVGCLLSAVCCRMLDIGYWPCRLLAVDAGCWLVVAGCPALALGSFHLKLIVLYKSSPTTPCIPITLLTHQRPHAAGRHEQSRPRKRRYNPHRQRTGSRCRPVKNTANMRWASMSMQAQTAQIARIAKFAPIIIHPGISHHSS